jgi:hypothetical protein
VRELLVQLEMKVKGKKFVKNGVLLFDVTPMKFKPSRRKSKAKS